MPTKKKVASPVVLVSLLSHAEIVVNLEMVKANLLIMVVVECVMMEGNWDFLLDCGFAVIRGKIGRKIMALVMQVAL